MGNIIQRTTSLAKLICDQYVNESSIVVDATCGNGNDTLYYATKCQKVYGFDIQQQAIDNSKALLEKNDCHNVELICDSHERMDQYVREEVDLVMFNLGYLPQGDKSITTQKASSLIALQKALDCIKVNGLVCVLLYYGHDSGKEEREAILQFVKELDNKRFHTGYCTSPNQKNNPPEIIFITRKK